MEGREPFSRNVGSKLLFVAFLLLVFGVIALVLLALGSVFAPPPPAGAEPGPGIVGAIMPGIILIVVAAIVGVLAGLMLGYDRARHEPPAL